LITVGVFGEFWVGAKVSSISAQLRSKGHELEAIMADRVAKSELETAIAKQRAAEAALELARLKAPRALTDAQANEISRSIAQFSGQEYELATIMGGAEPSAFAERIAEVLNAAHWKSTDSEGLRNIFGNRGISVLYHPKSGARTRDAASTLTKAIASCGISVALETDESTPANRVRIEVSDEPIKTTTK
jgi:hypothetical protein